MGGGKGGGSSYTPSAEYTQYKNNWEAQNVTDLDRLLFSKNKSDSFQFERQYHQDNKYAGIAPGLLDAYLQSKNIQGELTGTTLLSEQDYYTDKYNKQQQALAQQMAEQQAAQQRQIQEEQQRQQALIEQQAAQLKAQQEAAIKATKTSNRDSMLADRTSAEAAAVDYVNTQVANERSNAALFGMEYNITDEQKASRISNYFSDIWSEENETSLANLIKEVGAPQGFTGYTINRGTNGTATTQQTSTQNEKTVSTSQGTSGRKGLETSLLTDDLPNLSSTTMLLGA